VWLNYAEEIKNKTPRIHNYLKTHEPELLDNFEVRIKLDNNSQEAAFREKVFDKLVSHLRKTLNNYSIELLLGIDASQQLAVKSYTNKDKLKHLLDKNNKLKLLQEKFGLDLE